VAHPVPAWTARPYWPPVADDAEEAADAAVAVVRIEPAGGVFADGVVVEVTAAPADEVRCAAEASLDAGSELSRWSSDTIF
jgi:hypothetical protein